SARCSRRRWSTRRAAWSAWFRPTTRVLALCRRGTCGSSSVTPTWSARSWVPASAPAPWRPPALVLDLDLAVDLGGPVLDAEDAGHVGHDELGLVTLVLLAAAVPLPQVSFDVAGDNNHLPRSAGGGWSAAICLYAAGVGRVWRCGRLLGGDRHRGRGTAAVRYTQAQRECLSWSSPPPPR